MANLQKTLENNFGEEASHIGEELREEVWEALSTGSDYDDIELILSGYGLEMDYIEELI